MQPIITVSQLTKTYASGFQALKGIDLQIRRGEIFALLGPNGAGKTTLISIICGIVNASGGTVTADGHDIVRDFRAARQKIGLVPQELTTDAFESVWATVNFSRGLFGKPRDPALVEKILRELSLWEKKDSRIMQLSGGMKRRVMIAKALSHEPSILFLDEPSAGVDVELRRTLWSFMSDLHRKGTTVVLTTHYLEEAQDLCERIAIIDKGQVKVIETTQQLLDRQAFRFLRLKLGNGGVLPEALRPLVSEEKNGVTELRLERERHPIAGVFAALRAAGLDIDDVHTREPDLEDIFIELTGRQPAAAAGAAP